MASTAGPTRISVESPQIRWARRTGLALLLLSSVAIVWTWGLVSATAEVAERTWAVGSFLLLLLGGIVLLQRYWSAYRAWGWSVWGCWLWLALVGHGLYWDDWPGWAHGLAFGLVWGGLFRAFRYYRRRTRTETVIVLLACILFVGGGVVVTSGLGEEAALQLTLSRVGLWGLMVGAVGMTGLASIGLFRPVFALTCEPLLWLMYAVRWRGGAEGQIPAHGPCLVIANHACWGDPFFLEKVLPRPTTPMMTSKFYDLPFLRPLMRHFGVIRVPDVSYKKDAPEVEEAIAALDRGECLVIFAEGYLRRREDCLLRRFGRGVWLILQQRPEVPVFACWIEGNWGSFTSYWNGPPLRNKRPDFRRPIQVAVTGPHWVPAEVLADHWHTRFYLMDLVDAARQQLGLPSLGPFVTSSVAGLTDSQSQPQDEDEEHPQG